jgi:hypothetical protein
MAKPTLPPLQRFFLAWCAKCKKHAKEHADGTVQKKCFYQQTFFEPLAVDDLDADLYEQIRSDIGADESMKESHILRLRAELLYLWNRRLLGV